MKLTDDAKRLIEEKYSQDTSDDVLVHLRRNFSFYSVKTLFTGTVIKFINVDGKSYVVEHNKKFLVNRISYIIKDRFSHISEGVMRRTVKKYIDLILSLDIY
jgi:hypothetical protein